MDVTITITYNEVYALVGSQYPFLGAAPQFRTYSKFAPPFRTRATAPPMSPDHPTRLDRNCDGPTYTASSR